MGWLDTTVNLNYPNGSTTELPDAFAAQWPAWEVASPQYPQPSAYTLLTEGYRKNELIYALIAKRMSSISEPNMVEFMRGQSGAVTAGAKASSRKRKTDAAVDDSELTALLRNPNPAMSEVEFWQANQIYMDYAGFAAWEIEFSNGGDPLHLWPMSPHYCSFLRGPGEPIRAIRYQPNGLPYQDIPIRKILLFQEYDPLYPMLKGLSRTGVALRIIGVDNKATDFLYEFFKHGAISYGLLSTEQSLNDATAEGIRRRWHQQHGGSENWSNMAVLGSGTKFQSISLNFKEMAFDALDGRTEARLCMVYETPAILLGAKVGLAASTYSNYQQARSGWYEETVQPRWRYYSGEVTKQLLPLWRPDEPRAYKYYAGFDTKTVKALQEDRTAMWDRAEKAAAQNLLTRDEAREEMGMDPIDNEDVFVGVTVKGEDSPADVTAIGGVTDEDKFPPKPAPAAPAPFGMHPALAAPGVPSPATADPAVATNAGGPSETPAAPAAPKAEAPAPEQVAKQAEAKQFKAFARARIAEKKLNRVGAFKFRFHTEGEAKSMVLDMLGALAQQPETPAGTGPAPRAPEQQVGVTFTSKQQALIGKLSELTAEVKAARLALEQAEA